MVSSTNHNRKDQIHPGRISHVLNGVIEFRDKSGPLWWMPKDISGGIPEVRSLAVLSVSVLRSACLTCPMGSEVCAGSELCAAGRVQMHISVHAGIIIFFFASAQGSRQATPTFDL